MSHQTLRRSVQHDMTTYDMPIITRNSKGKDMIDKLLLKKLLLKTGIYSIQEKILGQHPELKYDCPVSKYNISQLYALIDKSKSYHELSTKDKKIFKDMGRIIENNDTELTTNIEETIKTINLLDKTQETVITKTMTLRQLYESDNPLWAQNLSISRIYMFSDAIEIMSKLENRAAFGKTEKETLLNELYDIMNETTEWVMEMTQFRNKLNERLSRLMMEKLHAQMMHDYHKYETGYASAIMSHRFIK